MHHVRKHTPRFEFQSSKKKIARGGTSTSHRIVRKRGIAAHPRGTEGGPCEKNQRSAVQERAGERSNETGSDASTTILLLDSAPDEVTVKKEKARQRRTSKEIGATGQWCVQSKAPRPWDERTKYREGSHSGCLARGHRERSTEARESGALRESTVRHDS